MILLRMESWNKNERNSYFLHQSKISIYLLVGKKKIFFDEILLNSSE